MIFNPRISKIQDIMDEPQHIESPCISVCQLDSTSGFCTGCFRTRDEIAIWGRADSATRLAILDAIRERRVAAGGSPRRETRRSRPKS